MNEVTKNSLRHKKSVLGGGWDWISRITTPARNKHRNEGRQYARTGCATTGGESKRRQSGNNEEFVADADQRGANTGEWRQMRSQAEVMRDTEEGRRNAERARADEAEIQEEGEKEIEGHAALRSDNNPRQRTKMRVHMRLFAGEPPSGALVWYQPGISESFPRLSDTWLKSLAAHMLANWKQATLGACQTCTGWMYDEETMNNPWMAGKPKWKRITAGYEKSRTEKAKKNGDKNAKSLQGRIPSHAQEASVEAGLKHDAAPLDVAEIALLNIGIVCLLRGSSLYFKGEEGVKFVGDTMCVTSEETKGKANEPFRQVMWVPGDADGTPRAKLLRLVRKALNGRGLNIITSAKAATKEVTAMIEKHFPPSRTGLDPKVNLASHCLRRTGASALHAMCGPGDFATIVMPWGGWKSIASALRYVKGRYILTVYAQQLWDFLMTRGAIQVYLTGEFGAVPAVENAQAIE